VRVTTFVALVSLSALVLFAPTSAGADSPSSPVVTDAINWLLTQQQSDGGFDHFPAFPGFETPDAILAVAEGAQTTSTWSTTEAFAAVDAVHFGGPGGPTPLDYIDNWIAGGVDSGEASKIVLLVVAPLGLDPTDFGAGHTDLKQLVYPSGCGAAPDTANDFFDEIILVALGGTVLCDAPDADLVTQIRAAQRADGGWNFLGSPNDDTDSDGDTTSSALLTILASGAAWNDPAVLAGLKFLAAQYDPTTGAFKSFGFDDPNGTATSMFAITAAGFDASSSCWRVTADPSTTGTPYLDPAGYLRSAQGQDGEIGSATNTFGTTQSVEALLLSWWPLTRAAGAPDCAATPTPTPTPTPDPTPTSDDIIVSAEAVVAAPNFTG
jgi:hypothetical protein